MWSRALPLLAVVAAPASGAETAAPIAKVLSMLSDLQGKIVAEGKAAHKTFSEFTEFCEDRARELGHEIKTGGADVEELKAAIAEHSATISSKTSKVEDLAGSVASNEADLAKAVGLREKEAKDFAAEEHELVETIDMISRASGIIEREMSKGGAALLQMQSAESLAQALDVMVRVSAIESGDAARLTALVQEGSDDAEPGAPAGAVYESKSGSLVETLQGLEDKAEGQLEDARKKETEARHNFELLEQSLKDEIKFANREMSEAKQEIAVATEKKSEAEGELQATSKELAADVEARGELHQDCMDKAADFEAETKSRGEELGALAKAKEIIEEATSSASLAQVSSFVQTGLRVRSALSNSGRAISLIRGLARKQHSSQLALLATRLAAVAHHGAGARGVFDKIKTMISDMVAKLEKEAEEATTKKAYCDKELAETSAKKEHRSDQLSALATKLEAAGAKSAQLKEQVAELQRQLGALIKSQAEMDKLRASEKAIYEESKAELEKGLEGLRGALTILKDYYAQDASHEKKEGAAGGIVSLLEVCESDFAKNSAEITSEEESAAAAYEKESQENQIEKVSKEGDIKYKTKEAKALDKTAAELRGDHDSIAEELEAVEEYLRQITAECTVVPMSYEEKQRRREAEIDGLKNALEVLDAQSFVQRSAARRSLRVRRAA